MSRSSVAAEHAVSTMELTEAMDSVPWISVMPDYLLVIWNTFTEPQKDALTKWATELDRERASR